MPEALDRDLIVARLSNAARRWLRELQIHEEIDSTNSHLLRNAARGVDGVICLAEHQTGGRGRRGRTWLAPRGRSIALSLGRRMKVPVSQIAPLSLVVGVAVADALGRQNVRGVALKWPNDVLLDGVKVGGILVEMASAMEPCVVIGVGINMGSGDELSSQLGFGVGDVLRSNRLVSRNAMVAALIDSIVDFSGAFETHGFEPMRDSWERLDAYRDQSVEMRASDGVVRGIDRGVSEKGELRLHTATGERYFNSGEVSLRVADETS